MTESVYLHIYTENRYDSGATKKQKNGWLIRAEVYSDGMCIRLRGQGDIIEIVDDGGKK